MKDERIEDKKIKNVVGGGRLPDILESKAPAPTMEVCPYCKKYLLVGLDGKCSNCLNFVK